MRSWTAYLKIMKPDTTRHTVTHLRMSETGLEKNVKILITASAARTMCPQEKIRVGILQSHQVKRMLHCEALGKYLLPILSFVREGHSDDPRIWDTLENVESL